VTGSRWLRLTVLFMAAAPAGIAPGADDGATRVRLKLDVRGELFAPAGRDVPPERRAIGLAARFDFRETPDPEAGPATVQRRYDDATAELSIDGQSSRTVLGADARTLQVTLRGATPTPWLHGAFLTRDECDLLETPFDPLLVEGVRPPEPVAPGDAWDVPADVTAGLLAIDTVEGGGIEATLADVADGQATLRLAGTVTGAADGVPTTVRVAGTCHVALPDATVFPASLAGRITTVSVTIAERREAGHVAPGFDVEARLQLARTEPAAGAPAGESPPAPTVPRRTGPGRPGVVWHRDPAGRYDLVHDARWRVVEDGPDGLVMRLVDRGALVAQCAIVPLPPADAREPLVIAAIQGDLERSLTGQFSRFESASEAQRSDGLEIVRVVAAGTVDEVPFRWIHHVVRDAAGRRLALTSMLEAAQAERFGPADRELVDGIRLAPADAAAPGGPSAREARRPRESRTP